MLGCFPPHLNIQVLQALPEAAGAAQSSLEGLTLPKMPKASALRRQLGSSRKLIRRYPALSCPSTGWGTGDRQEGLFQSQRKRARRAQHSRQGGTAHPQIPCAIRNSA